MFRFEILNMNANFFIYSRTPIIWSVMTDLFEFPENNIKKMSKYAEHVDQLFISMAATIFGQDIIILHVHQDTSSIRMYVLHPGGLFSSGERSQENPIFVAIVAYYEQIRFGSGHYHYQAIEPVSNGPVLKDLLAKGGRDIVRILSLPEQSTHVRIREKIDRNLKINRLEKETDGLEKLCLNFQFICF